MAKKATTYGLAVIGTSVPDALAAIKEELKSLRTITETQYKTGASGNVTSFAKSIQEETSIETLVKMVSSVRGRQNAYNNAVGELSKLTGGSLSVPVFKDNSASADNIVADVALRIQVLSVKERKEELEALVKEAEGFMTKEDQFVIFQKKLASKLGLKA